MKKKRLAKKAEKPSNAEAGHGNGFQEQEVSRTKGTLFLVNINIQ